MTRFFFAVSLLALGGPALADHETMLGPLAGVAETGITGSWSGSVEGEWFILRNDQDGAELVLSVNAGQAPDSGRVTQVNVAMQADEGTAATGIVFENPQAGAICVAEVTVGGSAVLFCNENGQSNTIANVTGVARMDGSDVLEVLEIPGAAQFSVNGQVIGEIAGSAALGADIGLMTYDRGQFAVADFAIFDVPAEGGGLGTGGQATGAGDPEVARIMGQPFADVVATKPVREGWSAYTQDGWFVLENAGAQNDTFGYVVDVGWADQNGRVSSVQGAFYPTEQMSAEDIASSTFGLMIQNRDNGNSCLGEITAQANAVLTCFVGSDVQEIGRLNGVAKMDGSDIVSLSEFPGSVQFQVNGQVLGQIDGHPAQGTEIGVVAYNPGRFFVSGFHVSNIQQQTGTGEVAAASGDGGGPLPMFDGESGRITSTYLGVLTGIFLHEFGHALIGELQLPSTGPEEDAVDIFSALRISSPGALDGGSAEANKINQDMALYAALQWYYSGMMAEQQGQSGVPWQDEHTADLKRFRNTYCVIYGGNPGLFGGIAEAVNMDERTLSRCGEEFTKQNRAWRTILAPHTRVSEYYPEGMLGRDAPGAKLVAQFEPSSRQVGNFVKTIIGDSGTFQGYLDGLSADYALPRDIPVIFKDCGELNAWYSPSEGSVTMCYDLIEYLIVMISDIEMGTQGGYAAGTAQQATGTGGTVSGQGNLGASTAPFVEGQAGGQTGGATGAQPFDELADMGVPVTRVLFPAPGRGPTPNGHATARIVTTEDVATLLTDDGQQWVLIDTRGEGQSLPGALIEPLAGRDGSLTDTFQANIDGWLNEVTGGNTGVHLIFFGNGPNDRSSYNGALRAAALGRYASVLWYRGGEEAWVANALPLE
ncbi:DUF4344 domain-containing metallopeptidase [Neogemmobacter tilapiae]|uniref:Rhodanese domain-containing protein n=1 Tax=Neogemmobacter tilapiae TaxID=875041 RepID=A0A918TIF7_9RHOB|nr:DUF4344 domain-containing metallopeptidase [Gemmobacter tilapiae]GHC46423.1 hypothetical protein GCM10007315_05140 [Gemmobacter tilapiae]